LNPKSIFSKSCPGIGIFTHKSDFALGLQVYNRNIFLYTKMNFLIAKSCSEIGRVNNPLRLMRETRIKKLSGDKHSQDGDPLSPNKIV
jgi:hypothetical protein